MPRVLIVSLGDDSVASSRVRAGSLERSFRELGLKPVRITADRRIWPLRALVAIAFRPRLTVLQKIAPPKWFTSFLRAGSSTLIVDIDDAIYFGYPNQKRSPQRVNQRVEFAINLADLTVVSNARIAQDIQPSSRQEIVVFPGPSPRVRRGYSYPKERLALWLGSPSTFTFFSRVIYPELENLAAHGVRVIAVGASTRSQTGPIRCVPWSPEEEERSLGAASIGLVPHIASEWADRKAAYKIFEYLSANVIPVFEMTPAIDLLLGNCLDTIGVQVHDNDWISAINAGFEVQITDVWLAARDEVFRRWNPERYARIFLTTANLEVGMRNVG